MQGQHRMDNSWPPLQDLGPGWEHLQGGIWVISSAACWTCDIRAYEFSRACWCLLTASSHTRLPDSPYGPQKCPTPHWRS